MHVFAKGFSGGARSITRELPHDTHGELIQKSRLTKPLDLREIDLEGLSHLPSGEFKPIWVGLSMLGNFVADGFGVTMNSEVHRDSR